MTVDVRTILTDLVGEDEDETVEVDSVVLRGWSGGRRILRRITRRKDAIVDDLTGGEQARLMLVDYLEFTVGSEGWIRVEYREKDADAGE